MVMTYYILVICIWFSFCHHIRVCKRALENFWLLSWSKILHHENFFTYHNFILITDLKIVPSSFIFKVLHISFVWEHSNFIILYILLLLYCKHSTKFENSEENQINNIGSWYQNGHDTQVSTATQNKMELLFRESRRGRRQKVMCIGGVASDCCKKKSSRELNNSRPRRRWWSPDWICATQSAGDS